MGLPISKCGCVQMTRSRPSSSPRPPLTFALVLAALLAAAPVRGAADTPRGAAPPDCPNADAMHAGFTDVLHRHVHHGWVHYAALAREDRPALDRYLATLAAVTPACLATWTRPQRFAFWINAYNAYTIRLVLDHYPIASIRSVGWFPGAAFRERFIPIRAVPGTPLSLNDIEHKILRPTFRDARVHFAIVCASKSCPPLRAEAYRGADLDRQLDDQARRFLADPTKNTADASARVLRLSKIFDWFREDFERDAGSLLDYVRRYAPPQMAAVAEAPGVRIQFLDYDWTLNGA